MPTRAYALGSARGSGVGGAAREAQQRRGFQCCAPKGLREARRSWCTCSARGGWQWHHDETQARLLSAEGPTQRAQNRCMEGLQLELTSSGAPHSAALRLGRLSGRPDAALLRSAEQRTTSGPDTPTDSPADALATPLVVRWVAQLSRGHAHGLAAQHRLAALSLCLCLSVSVSLGPRRPFSCVSKRWSLWAAPMRAGGR